jgi:hypothetical protein
MNLTAEQLQQIEESAKLGFSPSEIAIIIQVDAEQFELSISDNKHPAFIALMRGSLLAQQSIRQSAYDNARTGSVPSQNEMLRLYKSQINQVKSIIGNHE